jgi:mRNA interferase MazF
MKRGDIITMADLGGDCTGKPRPAVVVRADVFGNLKSVTVCPLTSSPTEALFRVPVQSSDELPLNQPSKIMVDKVTTIRPERVGKVIGKLSAADIQRLNGSLMVFLGLA